MKACAIVVSCGRPELAACLAMWARQSAAVPLLVWLDDAPDVRVWDAPPHFVVHHAERIGGAIELGAVRNAAVAHARKLFHLDEDDAFIVLDDDDYYARDHAEKTLRVLALGAAWTGARRIGLQRDEAVPSLVESDDGPGQHATWAMRFGLFDAAGGYPLTRDEDVALANRIGWHRCSPHWHLTHVRRHHGANLSALGCNRDVARARSRAAGPMALAIDGGIIAVDAWVAGQERPSAHFAARAFR